MTYVVTEACIKCKYMDCVEVCPVDCFYEGENMLVINPDECIDCGVCEPECPPKAIVPDTEKGIDDRDGTAHRGADLTRRLLAYARRQPLRPYRTNVDDLVDGVARLLARMLGEKDRKSTRLNSSHRSLSRMPSSA